MKQRNGFTLIEVIVILAVMAVLAAIAIPMALRIFQVATEDATTTEMQNLKKALLGDPEKLQSSTRSDFGFLGDIGCLPTTALGGLDRGDQLALVVGLPALDPHTAALAVGLDLAVDLGQRETTVDLGLARAEQVQVRTVEDQDGFSHLSPPASSGGASPAFRTRLRPAALAW